MSRFMIDEILSKVYLVSMLMKFQCLYILPACVLSHIHYHCTTQTPQTPQALMRKIYT